MKTYYIYEIINPNNQTYIGCTSHIWNRKNQYKNLKRKHGLISESISIYGFDNHLFNEIDKMQGSLNDAYSLEMFWIRTKMSNANKYPHVNGLNLTDGGPGSRFWRGKQLSTDHKNKLSISHKGKISHLRKPIIQCDDNGEAIKEFASLTEAAKYFGFKGITGISNVLCGTSTSCKGFKFKYKED